MKKIYKYRLARHTVRATAIYFAVFVLVGVGLYFLYEGGFLSAWFTSFIGALIALMSLSVPRKIVVNNRGLHIFCLLDLTELQRDEIAAVRQVDTKEMKGFFPIFGGYGFFGYYGHFLDLKNFERVRIYASEWQNFVEITDIYERRIYVSCTQPQELVRDLQELIDRNREEEKKEAQQQDSDEELQ